MKLAWTEKLSVGNAFIDSDHQHLIGMVNDVMHSISERDCHAIKKAFELIENGLCIHFANEEHIARVVKFDFSNHKSAQQYSLKELQHLGSELVAKDGAWSDGAVAHFARFLKKWMIDSHIVKLDMQMKPTLQHHDYKFWPGWVDGEVNHVAGHVAELYLRVSSGK